LSKFKLCPRCQDVTIHVSVSVCSMCDAPMPPVPCPCFQCGKPLGWDDRTGEHADAMVCVRNIRGDYIVALREVQRLKGIIENATKQNVCKVAP